jgi:transcriptional regulator with XRE-family HTH domain
MRKNTQQLLGRRFADLRKRAKLTQGEVAQRLNVATATVSRLERGTQWTDFPTLLGLCELYGVEWAELMAIPGGRDSAYAAAMQQLVDILRGCSAVEVEFVRDLAEVAMRNRAKVARRKASTP